MRDQLLKNCRQLNMLMGGIGGFFLVTGKEITLMEIQYCVLLVIYLPLMRYLVPIINVTLFLSIQQLRVQVK